MLPLHPEREEKGNVQLCLKEEKVNTGLLGKTRCHLNPRYTKYFLKSFGIWSPLLMELIDSGKKEFRRTGRENMGQETKTASGIDMRIRKSTTDIGR